MKKRLNNIISYRILSLVIILSLIFSVQMSTVTSRADESSDAKKEYEEKLQQAKDYKAELEKKKQDTEKKLAELEAARANILDYITQLDAEMTAVTAELIELRGQIADTEVELEQTKLELEEAKKVEADHYETMKNRIRYIYENGETSIMEVILASGSMTEMLNNAEYAYRVAEYDNNLLDRYIEVKEIVINKEASLEASLEALETMEETVSFQQQTLEGMIASKADEIARYTESIGITDELLFVYGEEIMEQGMAIEEIIEEEQKRLEEEERKRKEEEERLAREAEELRKRLEAEAAAGNSSKHDSSGGYDTEAIKDVVLTDETSASKMIWPLPGDYSVFDRFGPRKAPLPGATTYHKGWDIGGEYEAPIVAVLAGTVLYATSNASAGNYVRIDHGNGINSVYCHASKLLVEAGQYVQQGEVVALVGSTGVSTAPHLHFALTSNGTYIDPQPYIGHFVD